MAGVLELKPHQLYRSCDPARLAFDTTAQLEDLVQVFGQPRAVGAVEFGIGIEREGYSLFVMGPPGREDGSPAAALFWQESALERRRLETLLAGLRCPLVLMP